MRDRIHWIDNLKALGIFLVVFAHHENEIPKILLKYIYSFHVPLFFFSSGLIYLPHRYPSFKSFVIDKVRHLLVPYFILSLLTYVFWVAAEPFRDVKTPHGEILMQVIGIAISSNGIFWMAHNPPMWFLTCLFVVFIIFHALQRCSLRLPEASASWAFCLAVLLLSILGKLDSAYLMFRLPWGIDVALTGTSFFALGFLAKKKLSSSSSTRIDFGSTLLLVILGACSILFSQMNDFVNLSFNRLGNYFYFYAAGISGIGFCILISKLIPPNRILNYVGLNSLAILALHSSAFNIIRGVDKFLLPHLGLHVLDAPLINAIIYSVLQILLTIPAIYIINQYFPFMVGQRKSPATVST
jgi:acyltransferase